MLRRNPTEKVSHIIPFLWTILLLLATITLSSPIHAQPLTTLTKPISFSDDTSPTTETTTTFTLPNPSLIPPILLTPEPTPNPTPPPETNETSTPNPPEGFHIGYWLSRIAIVVTLALLGWWMVGIFTALSRKKQYQEFLIDDQPSINERLLSELAPMQVALLRGNILGFYEKVFAMTTQLLRSRKLIEDNEDSAEIIIQRLKTKGVDVVFLDCVESIFQRCDAVRLENDQPDQSAHDRIIKDLDSLIHMRPHTLSKKEPKLLKSTEKKDTDGIID